MKVLVINAGSSSLKYQLLDMKKEKLIAKGNCEKIGLAGSFVSLKANGTEKIVKVKLDNHDDAMENVIKLLLDKENNVLSSLSEIVAFIFVFSSFSINDVAIICSGMITSFSIS